MAANPSIQLGTDGNWAIKEDNLLAYKKDGTRFFNKEFDFTRGSLATFVDKDGLIKTAGLQETNLVQNGDFATDSDWSLGSGWNIESGSLNAIGARGYALQTNVLAQGTNAILKVQWTQTITSGTRLRFFARNYNDSSVETVLSGSATNGGVYSNSNCVGSGTYTIYVSVTNGYSFKLLAESGNNATVDNVSVKEIQLDVPRIDFTDDATGHLLLEPQRTNLIKQSEYFNSSEWTINSSTIVDNDSISPQGVRNAARWTSTASGTHIQDSVYVDDPSNFSLFVKYVDYSYIKLYSGASGNYYVNFDIKNNVIGNSGSLTSNEKIESYGDGWYRISCTFSGVAAGSSVRVGFANSLTSTWGGLNTSGGGEVLIFGAQFETGIYPTSYIPTFGSTVTRNAEVCNNSGSAQDFNSEEGVIYADIAALESTSLGSKFIAISDETYNNRASILFSNGSTNQIRCFLRVGGVSQVDETTNITDVTDFNKVAFSYKENEFKVFVNGSQASSTDTSGSVWTSGTITKLSLTEINSALGAFNGKVRKLQVFKRAMSDGELYLLTVPQYQSYQEMATALNYTL